MRQRRRDGTAHGELFARKLYTRVALDLLQQNKRLSAYLPAELTAGATVHVPTAYNSRVNDADMATLEPHAIDVECGPGDVLFFSNLLVHRGGFNSSGAIRWTLDWRFQDESKPTCRAMTGHCVWAKDPEAPNVCRTPAEWAALELA